MPRPTLFDHPKFQRLVHILKLPEPHVLGHLEYLWRVGYSSGNPVIGDDLDVELAAKWVGDAGVFAQALESVRLMDRGEDGKLSIHDLHANAPEYVTLRHARERERSEPKVCVHCHATYFSADPRSKHCSSACRSGAWRDRQRHTVTDENVTDTDRDTTPAPTPAPAPAPAPAQRERALAPTTAPAELWQGWVEAASARGIRCALTASPRDYQHLVTVLGLMSLDEARRALTEFWRSTHFDGKRNFGMFAANAGQLLAHADSGKREPFGVAPPARASRTAGNIEALSAFVARGRTGEVA